MGVIGFDKYLSYCLLYHAVLHRRNAEHSRPSVRLGNIHAAHRSRNIASRPDVFGNAPPVSPMVSFVLVDSHAVNARSPLIGNHLFDGSQDVSP